MYTPGLVSITFRQLAPKEIIALVVSSGALAIEWGGDVHVPHGDLTRAREVARMTDDVGLKTVSYGSYYRVGHDEPLPFERILETAEALGAPVVRVWAGKQGSDKADETYWKLVLQDSERIAALAAASNIIVSYEYHIHTLTDTSAGTLRLLDSVQAPNLNCYWQPRSDRSALENRDDLERLLPHLHYMHVFHWKDGKRLRLSEGLDDWQLFLASANKTGRNHAALLEFTLDDKPENYLQDMAALLELLKRQSQA